MRGYKIPTNHSSHQTILIKSTPAKDTWTAVKPQELFVHLIARATSRVVAGDALRRNEEWHNTASSYSVNVGITLFLLRPFPNFLRPLVAPFLPSVRQMKHQLRFVKSLFIPMINERRATEAANDPGYVKPDDFLQWMMDMAEDEQDHDPEALAHHMLLLMSLAIVHTSTMALCHALYDLILRPEYLGPLREEISRTLSDGWENATKMSLDAQRRMDSFLRESQRFGPPGECGCFFIFVYLLLSIQIDCRNVMLIYNSILPPHRQRAIHTIRWPPPPQRSTHLLPLRPNEQRPLLHRKSRCFRWVPMVSGSQ